MMKIFKAVPVLLIALSFSFSLSAQNNFFAESKESGIAITVNKRVIIPDKYKTVVLDVAGIKKLLSALTSAKNKVRPNQGTVLELSMPDGKTAKYNICGRPLMGTAL